MVRQFKIIVEKHQDGYVAYPLGLKGIVIGEGDTYEEALTDVKSAIAFHIETFAICSTAQRSGSSPRVPRVSPIFSIRLLAISEPFTK